MDKRLDELWNVIDSAFTTADRYESEAATARTPLAKVQCDAMALALRQFANSVEWSNGLAFDEEAKAQLREWCSRHKHSVFHRYVKVTA